MSYLWKKIEFYKGKVDDSIHKWDLGQSPGGVSGDKAPIFFWRFNVFKAIKWHTMPLKTIFMT